MVVTTRSKFRRHIVGLVRLGITRWEDIGRAFGDEWGFLMNVEGHLSRGESYEPLLKRWSTGKTPLVDKNWWRRTYEENAWRMAKRDDTPYPSPKKTLCRHCATAKDSRGRFLYLSYEASTRWRGLRARRKWRCLPPEKKWNAICVKCKHPCILDKK